MSAQYPLRHAIRHVLLAGATSTLLVTGAWAQSVPADGGTIEEVVITGSRIRANEFDAPTPTVAVSAAALEQSGVTNVAEFLRNQPALVGSSDTVQTTASFIGYTGLNLLDLRNLGSERTLVLVDGRRHVAQLPETAAVDTNTIPTELIERIDVVTGGVSAVYGADAVSGVVNFVMKRDFEGLVTTAQFGSGEGGRPQDWRLGLTAGSNFADGRGNVAMAIEHTSEGRLLARDRNYLRGENYTIMALNPDADPNDPTRPSYIPLGGLRFFDTARGGALDLDLVYPTLPPDSPPEVLADGSPYVISRYVEDYYSQGGSGTPVADFVNYLRAQTDTTIASLFTHYDLGRGATLFGEAKYVYGRSVAYDQPTFDYDIFLEPDNAYLSPGLIQQATAAQGGDFDGIIMLRDNFDLGARGERNARETFRTVVGIEGDLANDLHYEVSYVYGQTDVTALSLNNRYNDRFLAAVDAVIDPATGLPTCRSNLDPSAAVSAADSGLFSFTPGANSGCLPLNLLGEGVGDPAAIDWVMMDSRRRSRLTQNVVNAFISGPIPGIELPAGPIDAVVGVEWRRETSRTNPPLEDQAGYTFGNVILPTAGNFDVKEAFAEVRVPLLSNVPMAEQLQLTGAVRGSDYSTVGSTTTWNAGLLWAPIRDISFRGTVAESVRAPNISELFDPQSQTFAPIQDPCTPTRVGQGTSYRQANCLALLTSLGIDPTTYVDPNSSYVPGLGRGNTELTEETARSYTYGVVLRPRFVDGLAIAVDYYDINIKDAISTATAQTVVNNCVDQPSLDNVFCDALTRGADGGIDSFLLQPENVASFRTRGIDFNINYAIDPADWGVDANIGRFGLALVGNHLARLTNIPTPGAQQIDERETAYSPKWQASADLVWYFGGLTAQYGYNYHSETSRYSWLRRNADPNIAASRYIDYKALQTHDVSVSFDASSELRFYVGVRNLTNERPDLSLNYPVSPVGRFYYGGVKMGFGTNL